MHSRGKWAWVPLPGPSLAAESRAQQGKVETIER